LLTSFEWEHDDDDGGGDDGGDTLTGCNLPLQSAVVRLQRSLR